jgi:hypothetical protein
MSITKSIRTKLPVVIDSIKQTEAVVYIKILNVLYDGTSYAATAEYSVQEQSTEEENATFSKRVIALDSVKFLVEEAQAMEMLLEVEGTTVSERLADIIPKLTMYQAGVSSIFGLGPDDFEKADSIN